MAIGLKICPSCGLEPNDDVTSGCEDPQGCGKMKPSYNKIGKDHPDYDRIEYLKSVGVTFCDAVDHNESHCSNPNCFRNRKG